MLSHDTPVCLASLEWATPKEGGRSAPPPGPCYVAPARIGPWAGNLPEEATYSLVSELVQRIDDLHWEARITFLVREAPHHLLQPGATFELYEGRRCVARGRVAMAVATCR